VGFDFVRLSSNHFPGVGGVLLSLLIGEPGGVANPDEEPKDKGPEDEGPMGKERLGEEPMDEDTAGEEVLRFY